jgi:hypothetical protein
VVILDACRKELDESAAAKIAKIEQEEGKYLLAPSSTWAPTATPTGISYPACDYPVANVGRSRFFEKKIFDSVCAWLVFSRPIRAAPRPRGVGASRR